MSRVQKKPIRRKLKDVTAKAEEPREIQETIQDVEEKQEPVVVRERVSRIPRSPRPEIASKPEEEKPARREFTPREDRPVREERSEPRENRPATRDSRPASREEFGNDRRENGGRFEKRGDRTGKYGKDDRNGKFGKGGKKPEKKKRPEKIVFEKTKQFVLPGNVVGVIEEYKPGFGTINDDGTIRATVPGVIGFNNDQRIITVIPKTKTPNVITEGDIVIATVTDIRESNARVEIVAAEKSLGEEIVNNGNAEIYISNIKDGFAKTVSDEFGINDIVRAKVIDSSKIGLSTVDTQLGVIKAYCAKCKTSLIKGEDALICPHCGNKEQRKIADGYGKGVVCV